MSELAVADHAVTQVTKKSDAALARLEDVKADPHSMSVIAQRVADEETLRQIAKAWQVPYAGLFGWIREDDKRWAEYERALAVRADALVAETVAISDEQALAVSKQGTPFDPDVPRDKLRIDTRFKAAARFDPKRFGDTASVGAGGSGLKVVVVRFPESTPGGVLPEITTIESSGI